MKKVGFFFIILSLLSILTACGQTGSLYYPKPQKHPPKQTQTKKTSSVTVQKSKAS